MFRDDVLAMKGYVPGEQPRGVSKFIKLNTNENPYPPSPAVGKAVAAAVERGLQRYPDPMAESFRQRAAEVLGVEPNWILCGNGSDDILTVVTRACVGQGDLLRLPYPSYILYKTLAQLQGAKSEEIHFAADWSLGDDFVRPDPRLKLVFLPNPNSPSGTVLAPAQILEIAQRLSCPLLVDEAYADFADDNCLRLVRDCPNVIVSRTLSKSYGLAGLRFGFCVARPEVIEQLTKVKDSYNCDSLSIAAATAAIDDQVWLRQNRAKILATRLKLTAGLREIGFQALDSQANFVWATHPTAAAKMLYEKLKTNQILIRYMNYAGWGDGIRISVGTDEQNAACLALLKTMV